MNLQARQNQIPDLSKPDSVWHGINAMQIKLEHPELTEAQVEDAIAAKWQRYCDEAYFK